MRDHILAIQEGIRAGRYPNEASVSQGIVRRVLDQLGWPVYEPDVVAPEFSLEGRRVDYALCHPAARPILFIEVKQIGYAEGADRQLFEYAFHKGVPMAVLTDGQEWHFFLPAEQGEYSERRVYKLDLLARAPEESSERLKRYLEYTAVCSGQALENAKTDYKDIAKSRQIQAALPNAWAALLRDEDELLLELIAEKVESLCGYKPDAQTIANFLAQLPRLPAAPVAIPAKAVTPPKVGAPPEHAPSLSQTSQTGVGRRLGFRLLGKAHSARNALDVLIQILTELAQRDATFLARFAALPKQGRKRRYVDSIRDNLYPERPDLARDYSYQFLPGWWLGTNLSRQAIERVIRMACEVAGLTFGRDLTIELG